MSAADKVAELEREGEAVDLMVFLTNQDLKEPRVRSAKQDIEDEYGWPLYLYHRANIIGTLESQEPPRLAERHLGIDLSSDGDHLQEVHELVNERVKTITNRSRIASGLPEGPVAILHLIPTGVFSGKYVKRVDDLPIPPIYSMFHSGFSPNVTGRGKWVTNRRLTDKYPSYTYLRTDGLFEAVGTEHFVSDPHGKWIRNSARDTRHMLDQGFAINAKAGLARLQDMNVSGSVTACITFVGVNGYKMTLDNSSHRRSSFPTFSCEQYQTDLVAGDVSSGDLEIDSSVLRIGSDDPVFRMLEPAITQYWQEAGRKDGSPHYNEDREWCRSGFSLRMNN